MAVADRSAQFIVGADVLASERDATVGTILLQLGDSVVGDVESQAAEQWQQSGFASRPAVAAYGRSSCQVIGIRQGDRDVVIAQRDARSAAIYGELETGETCVYATAGMARVLFKADGSVTMLTTSDNTSSGTTLTMTLSPTQGFIVSTPWGGISIGPNGFQAFTQDGTSWGGSIGLSSSGVCQVTGAAFKAATSQCLLGMAATAATGCGYGIGAASLASTSVFVSP